MVQAIILLNSSRVFARKFCFWLLTMLDCCSTLIIDNTIKNNKHVWHNECIYSHTLRVLTIVGLFIKYSFRSNYAGCKS